MTLDINAIIIAVMYYREVSLINGTKGAKYITTYELDLISELFLDNFRTELECEVVFNDTINRKYFMCVHDLIIPCEYGAQTFEKMFKEIKNNTPEGMIKDTLFNERIIKNMLNCIRVLASEDYNKKKEGSEQHGKELRKVPNNK